MGLNGLEGSSVVVGDLFDGKLMYFLRGNTQGTYTE